ncbi:MAG TPA: hypothetical protein VKB56_08745 [Terriglobales bacterium]|nr:hypothetical protein [Terriglobales bacterium]
MSNWKRVAMFGAFGASVALIVRGRRPEGIALAGVGVALLAADHPEYLESLWERAPEYLDRGSQLVAVIARLKQRLEEEGPRAIPGTWQEITQE